MLVVRGKIDIPDGDENQLSVVMVGRLGGDSVPIVIRNRTSEALSTLAVSGTARGADGALIGSGASQGFAPELLEPGEWAFGYVYFEGPNLPADAKYDLTATGRQPDEFSSVDLRVAEVNRVSGDHGDQLVGIVENPSNTDEVGGPIDVIVACFNGRGTITSTHSDFAEASSIPPGGTSSFSVDFFDDACPSWALGSSGYSV
jgi:hypothetical protein